MIRSSLSRQKRINKRRLARQYRRLYSLFRADDPTQHKCYDTACRYAQAQREENKALTHDEREALNFFTDLTQVLEDEAQEEARALEERRKEYERRQAAKREQATNQTYVKQIGKEVPFLKRFILR